TQRQFDKSERHLQRAQALTPNDPRLIVQRGINSTYLGDSEAALPWIEQAMRVDPFSAARYETDVVRALFATKRVKEAVTLLEEDLESPPHPDLIRVSRARPERLSISMRREHDLLGDRDVPADAYYGVHTLRAVENFPISGTKISIYPDLVAALASIKLAAANSNRELGLLDGTRADAIIAASEEIRAGRLHEQFVVDVIQGGAGTSTNMNANEVIANRALELLGRPKGDYHFLHPNEHVNMSQSTNDVYPTALKLAAY